MTTFSLVETSKFSLEFSSSSVIIKEWWVMDHKSEYGVRSCLNTDRFPERYSRFVEDKKNKGMRSRLGSSLQSLHPLLSMFSSYPHFNHRSSLLPALKTKTLCAFRLSQNIASLFYILIRNKSFWRLINFVYFVHIFLLVKYSYYSLIFAVFCGNWFFLSMLKNRR